MKIDRNIPMPDSERNSYPFSEMKVGDSLESKKNTITLSNAARQWSMYNKNDWKWSVRKQDNGMSRIWRVK